jgi:hypothetical protein
MAFLKKRLGVADSKVFSGDCCDLKQGSNNMTSEGSFVIPS